MGKLKIGDVAKKNISDLVGDSYYEIVTTSLNAKPVKLQQIRGIIEGNNRYRLHSKRNYNSHPLYDSLRIIKAGRRGTPQKAAKAAKCKKQPSFGD